MLDLKKFKEAYLQLEEKSLKIMEVYGIGHYGLVGIGIEEYNGKTMFTIKTEFYYSGCGVESEWLEFELHEMNEPIKYFQDKRQKQLKEKEKLEKEKLENEKRLREQSERAKYEELKKKFENTQIK